MPDSRRPDGTWLKGGPSPNPGGKPKAVATLERELREAHGPYVFDIMAKMYDLAMGRCEGERLTRDGVVTVKLDPSPEAAKLFMNRILGPERAPQETVRDLDDAQLEQRFCEQLGITPEQLHGLRAREAAGLQ